MESAEARKRRLKRYRDYFQAVKADPEKYEARKRRVNLQRRGKGYGTTNHVIGK